MASITNPLPIYDGLLALASPDERAAILDGGPKECLYYDFCFGSDGDWEAPRAAHDAIRAILNGICHEPTLRVTGIDSRETPPRRATIEVEVILTGRLMWLKDGAVQSVLQFDWLSKTVKIINLRIEPVEPLQAMATTTMMPSLRLAAGERIDDADRLKRMQQLIDEGLPPKTAARRVAFEMPHTTATEDSTITRLSRKYNKRRS